MTDLQTILQAIDELPVEAIEQVRWHIDRRSVQKQNTLADEDAEMWISDLHDAIEEFRAELSEDELRDIVNSMNIGYIERR